MATTSINIILDLRRMKKDGTYPVKYQLIHNRTTTTISTPYSVSESEWDIKHEKIKKKCKKYGNPDIVNNKLHLLLSSFQTKIFSSDRMSKIKTAVELKKYLLNKDDEEDFISGTIKYAAFTKKIIKELESQGRYGNAGAYKRTLFFMKKYFRADFPFSALTPEVLRRIETKFLANGHSYNGLSFNLRTVRAIYNRAISYGIIDNSVYPFRRLSYEKDKYSIREEKTKKRAISKEVIKKIEEYHPEENSGKYDARNYFLFSFYCRGINIRDMAMLRKANVDGKILRYRRAKTKYTYEITLTNKAMDILRLYGFDKKKKSEFLFPMVTRDYNDALMHKDMYNAMRNTNKNLQRIAKDLHLDVHLTTYVARHSWATIADQLGVDRRIISQGLGHTSLSTTEIYINDIVSNNDLQNADELITGD